MDSFIKGTIFSSLIFSVFMFNAMANADSGANIIETGATKKVKKLPKILVFEKKKSEAAKKMALIISELKDEYKEVFEIEVINTKRFVNRRIVKRYKIKSELVMVFLNAKGKELTRHAGALSKKRILKVWGKLGYKFTGKNTEKLKVKN